MEHQKSAHLFLRREKNARGETREEEPWRQRREAAVVVVAVVVVVVVVDVVVIVAVSINALDRGIQRG